MTGRLSGIGRAFSDTTPLALGERRLKGVRACGHLRALSCAGSAAPTFRQGPT